jgi:eukaryotic-like serine/threonine-protein kinase
VTELKDRLETVLGADYRVERELGGGGMSRVFLAEESRLGRKVVIKVLPPEMAAGVNAERFEREIQLAAKLQHPHIVPLLTAGAAGDLLYYVMPYIEGESLRARLARERELPVAETVRILRDVLDALSYAHEQSIVHRDIKPDNVMLTRRHALVTDFGVAKAVAASTGASSLTSLGVALGTPAYMAPEQAAADPQVDYRADLYGLGAMAYEMLTGRPPFAGPTPQAVLSAHVLQPPEHVSVHRQTVPPALAELVMRCLAKKPADRPQRAEDLIPQLDTLLTPSGGVTPTGTQPVPAPDFGAKARHAHPLRVAALFSVAAVALLAVVYGLMLRLGLPSWVLAAAIGLIAVGLPVMLVTGQQERRRAMAQATGVHTVTPTGMRRLFTWKRAVTGGGVAFAGLAVAVGGVMTLRALGVGPFATLVSSGALKNRQTILLADFVNRAADSTLGPTLTEAFRVDLSQSPTVRLMEPQAIAATLEHMRRPVDTKMAPEVAREVAERAGVTAMVSGQIDPVGKGYVLSASVVATGDGGALTAVRATAADDAHLIPALDELSRALRARIGESLVTIRRTPPLDQVTTTSLDALRKYSEAIQRFDAGDFPGAGTLLRDAIARDSSFAMAYRKLGAVYLDTDAPYTDVVDVSTRAFRLRDHLPPAERDLATAWYYQMVDYEPDQASAAYRAVLERDSSNDVALGNLAMMLAAEHDYARAESLAARGIALGHRGTVYIIAAMVQAEQGRYGAADSTLDRGAAQSPHDPTFGFVRTSVAYGRGDYDNAERLASAAHDAAGGNAYVVVRSEGVLAGIEEARGQLAASAQLVETAVSSAPPAIALRAAVFLTPGMAVYLGDSAGARRLLDETLQRHPLSSIPLLDRPYPALAVGYAMAGRPDEARRLMTEYARDVPEGVRKGDVTVPEAEGAIALAEGKWAAAIAAFRRWNYVGFCAGCGLFEIGQAFDRLGETDSALANYVGSVTALNDFGTTAPTLAAYERAPAYHRIGEIYEARGDSAKAVEYYSKFVDLWKDADPKLQPLVQDAKTRIARLRAERG